MWLEQPSPKVRSLSIRSTKSTHPPVPHRMVLITDTGVQTFRDLVIKIQACVGEQERCHLDKCATMTTGSLTPSPHWVCAANREHSTDKVKTSAPALTKYTGGHSAHRPFPLVSLSQPPRTQSGAETQVPCSPGHTSVGRLPHLASVAYKLDLSAPFFGLTTPLAFRGQFTYTSPKWNRLE